MEKHRLAVPNWISHDDVILRPVDFKLQALDAIVELVNDGVPQLCSTADEAEKLITQVLRQDIRGIHQGRGSVQPLSTDVPNTEKTSPNKKVQIDEYMCRLDHMMIRFITNDRAIEVISVSGCDYGKLEDTEEDI
jgi:hypothetical protein